MFILDLGWVCVIFKADPLHKGFVHVPVPKIHDMVIMGYTWTGQCASTLFNQVVIDDSRYKHILEIQTGGGMLITNTYMLISRENSN